MLPNKLGEILVKQGMLRPDQLQTALTETQRTKNRLNPTLVTLNMLKDNQILQTLEKQYTLPGVDVSQFDIETCAVSDSANGMRSFSLQVL